MAEAHPPGLQADVSFWDRTARKYAASPIGDPEGYEKTLARTAELLTPEHDVLELGCGTGTTALRLAPAAGHYVATDLSPGMIEIANEKLAAAPQPKLEFLAATAENLAATHAGRFDVVLGFNYLHLVADLDQTLASIHRLLKPGGLFVSKTVCLKEMNPLVSLVIPLLRVFGKAPANLLRLDEETLTCAIRSAGFEIEAAERHGMKGKDVRPFIVARRA